MNVILKFWGKLSDLLSPIYKYSYNLVHIARAMVWWVTREDHPYIYLNSASPIPLLHFPSKASSFLSITYFSRFVFLLLFLFLSLTGYSFLLLQSVFFFFFGSTVTTLMPVWFLGISRNGRGNSSSLNLGFSNCFGT
jgi:hypothetical protein